MTFVDVGCAPSRVHAAGVARAAPIVKDVLIKLRRFILKIELFVD